MRVQPWEASTAVKSLRQCYSRKTMSQDNAFKSSAPQQLLMLSHRQATTILSSTKRASAHLKQAAIMYQQQLSSSLWIWPGLARHHTTHKCRNLATFCPFSRTLLLHLSETNEQSLLKLLGKQQKNRLEKIDKMIKRTASSPTHTV